MHRTCVVACRSTSWRRARTAAWRWRRSSTVVSSSSTGTASRSPTRRSCGNGHGCARGWTTTATDAACNGASATPPRAWHASADPSELYRGTRLDSALDWAAGHGVELTPHEQAFLDASAREAARELDDARRRAAEKARDNRRLRRSLIGLAALLIVAITAGLLFVRQRDRAESSARDARARALASNAAGAIGEDPELAMLLGLEAIDTTEEPLAAAVSALHAAIQASRLEYRRPEATQRVDVNRDGTRIVTRSAADPGAVLVWDAASGDLLATLPAPGADLFAEDVRFHPDGTTVAASYSNEIDGAAPAVVLWDSTSAQAEGVLTGADDAYFYVDFSADGRRLVTSSTGGGDSDDRVTIWDVATGAQTVSFQLPGFIGEAEFLPDDTAVLVGEGARERVGIYSTTDGSLLRSIPTPGFEPDGVALNAPSGWLALGSQPSRETRIVDFDTGRLLRRIPGSDSGPIDWSPDGARLSIAGANQAPIRVFDVSSGADPLVLSGHESGSWDAEFIGDGDRLASVGQVGELRVWDVSPDGPPALGAIAPASGSPWSVDFSPDGNEMLVSTSGQTIERLSAETGERLAARDAQLVGRLPFWAPVSPDGRFIASTNETDGTSAVLDARTLDPIATLPACTAPRGFSSDGTLLALDGRQLCVPEFTSVTFEAPAGAELRSRIIDVSSGREVLDLGEEIVNEVMFNPQGVFPADRYVAVNVDLTRLDLYDVVDGRPHRQPPGPQRPLQARFRPERPVARRVDRRRGGLGDRHGCGRPRRLRLKMPSCSTSWPTTLESPASTSAPTARWPPSDSARKSDCGTSTPANCSSNCRPIHRPDWPRSPSVPTAATCSTPTATCCADTTSTPNELVRLARSLVTRDLTPQECATFLIADCP